MKKRIHSLCAVAGILVVALGSLGAASAQPRGSADPLVSYQERRQRLAKDDIAGRLSLAQWCANQELFLQQAELCREILALEPSHVPAYRGLLAADARQTMAVDGKLTARQEAGLGPKFRLHHGPHFTILSDVEDNTAGALGEVMEETYRSVYEEGISLGLRPMPPKGRLVCLLFRRYDDFMGYLKREMGKEISWAGGCYLADSNQTVFFHSLDAPHYAERREKLAEIEERTDTLLDELARTPRKANRTRIEVELRQLDAAYEKLSEQLGSSADFATDSVTRHETAHQVLYNSGLLQRDRAYPFWLSEGLATNFELCDREGHAGPGFVNNNRLLTYRKWRKANELASLEQLLTEKPGADSDAAWVGARYAQAWALVHFLWNKRPEEFRDLLANLNREGTPRDWVGFFCDHFGDLDRVERDYRRYMDSLRPSR